MHLFKVIYLFVAAVMVASHSIPRFDSRNEHLQLRDIPDEPLEDATDSADSPSQPDEFLEEPTESTPNPLAKRSCFTVGATWGSDRDRALELVDKACREVFIGSYNGKTERSVCYNLGLFKRVNFKVRRWHDSTHNLEFEYCKTNLRLEIKGCNTGGQSYRGNWRFKSDPNAGRC